MGKTFRFVPGDHDRLEGLNSKRGPVSLLYMKGRRPEQQDALWAAEKDGIVMAYFADGVYAAEKSGEIASFAVDYAAASAKRQLEAAGLVDPRQMQADVYENIQREHPFHKGRATGLAVVIGDTFSAHRVGDPHVRMDKTNFPHAALLPEISAFLPDNLWLEENSETTDPKQVEQKLKAALRKKTSMTGQWLANAIGTEASRHGVASLSRLSANIPLEARRRFVAGTDGLEIQRLSYFYEEELARAKNPQEFMQDLMTELLAYGRDNTAGLAFFCER